MVTLKYWCIVNLNASKLNNYSIFRDYKMIERRKGWQKRKHLIDFVVVFILFLVVLWVVF